MESMKICKKCGQLMNYNSYFGGYYCASCGLLETDKELRREKLLKIANTRALERFRIAAK